MFKSLKSLESFKNNLLTPGNVVTFNNSFKAYEKSSMKLGERCKIYFFPFAPNFNTFNYHLVKMTPKYAIMILFKSTGDMPTPQSRAPKTLSLCREGWCGGSGDRLAIPSPTTPPPPHACMPYICQSFQNPTTCLHALY